MANSMDQTSSNQKPKIISLRDLFKGALGDFRQNWKKFACLLLIPLVAVYLISLVSFILNRYSNVAAWSWPIALAFVLIVIVFFIAFAVYYVLTYIAEFLLLKDLSQEVKFGNLRQWYQRARPYFWTITTISCLYAVLAVIGLILLIIPGIIFMVFYCFAIYAVIFEDRKFEGAFGRSRELVKGYWWAVFGRFVAGGVVVYLAYVIIGGIYALFIWLMVYLLRFDSRAANDLFALMYDLLSVFIGLAIGPLTMLYTYKIYKSLKETKNI